MLALQSYSHIGKGVILRAVGLQENYKDLEKAEKSGKVTYVNERNRYGYAKRLKLLPLKLLLLYHHLPIDKCSIIKGASVEELAKKLKCDERSILAANRCLEEYGYIRMSNGIIPNKFINVLLPEYKEYCLLSRQGGMGFICTSVDILEELLELKSVVAMRIYLRALVEHNTESSHHDYKNVISKKYSVMRRQLPAYCKKNVIEKVLSDNPTKIFNVTLEDKSATFSLNEGYDSKIIKERHLNSAKEFFKNSISEFNVNCQYIFDSIRNDKHQLILDVEIMRSADRLKANLDLITNPGLKRAATVLVNKYDLFILPTGKSNPTYKRIKADEKDITDLASMALEYSESAVFTELASVYRDYISNDIEIKSLGALVRKYLKNQAIENKNLGNIA